jgi:predicted kinase
VATREGVTYGEVFKREIKNAEQNMEANLASALAQGKDIVWDQTNMTRKSRLKKVGRLLDAGYTVDAHVFMPDAHELHQRQFKRAVATGKAIPQRVIDSMMENYEHPLEEEGFASITHYN